MDLHLKNKRVLVQGSSSGLGFAIAKAYAEEGALVAICSRDKKRIREAALQIPRSIPFLCDLSETGSALFLVEEVSKKLGGIDILITNNGGPPKGAFSDLSMEKWQEGFQSLWISAIESIKASLPFMKEQKWGRILLSTSTAAKEPIPSLTVSNALRSGLLGLMKTISQEVAPFGITVNALLPGYTKTERLEELGISDEILAASIPAKRLGKPEEFAALATFLGSEQASYITGQAIACDGGLIRGL
jgi:3-oxoacyl-[acyl-carrier protein] reductase